MAGHVAGTRGQFKLFRSDQSPPSGWLCGPIGSEQTENWLEAGSGKLSPDDLALRSQSVPSGTDRALRATGRHCGRSKKHSPSGESLKLHRRNEQGERETVMVEGEASREGPGEAAPSR